MNQTIARIAAASTHTREDVEAAFAAAPKILTQLVDLGLPYANFQLYHDGSGILWLGLEGEIDATQIEAVKCLLPGEVWQVACPICTATRRDYQNASSHACEIGFSFSHALVEAAERSAHSSVA